MPTIERPECAISETGDARRSNDALHIHPITDPWPTASSSRASADAHASFSWIRPTNDSRGLGKDLLRGA